MEACKLAVEQQQWLLNVSHTMQQHWHANEVLSSLNILPDLAPMLAINCAIGMPMSHVSCLMLPAYFQADLLADYSCIRSLRALTMFQGCLTQSLNALMIRSHHLCRQAGICTLDLNKQCQAEPKHWLAQAVSVDLDLRWLARTELP